MNYKPAPTDVMSAYARERFGLHEDWKWCQCTFGQPNDDELPEGTCRLRGAAYLVKERGKNKGRPDYKKPLEGTQRTVFFTATELEAWELDREQRLGICKDCVNTGKCWIGWSKDEGTKYRRCTRCKAEPKAKPQELFA